MPPHVTETLPHGGGDVAVKDLTKPASKAKGQVAKTPKRKAGHFLRQK